jgi:hypothetical protein
VIDRKTALASAALIALMLAAAVWWNMMSNVPPLTLPSGAPLPSLLLFIFPACSALVVGRTKGASAFC